MTTTAPPLVPTQRPSFYDRWRARVHGEPRLQRLYGWLAPLLITLLAAVLRLWNLGHPHTLVFDETYYVKDAWSQWNLGFASTWPEGADASFVAGDTDIFTGEGSFVVHPPLGKFLIGLGMAVFGPESSVGWRISAALFGTALVLLLFFVAKTLTRSLVFASVVSLLLAIDGLGIAMSRISLLDIFLSFFILLAFWFVLFDREWQQQRVAAAVDALTVGGEPPTWGPIFWNRPWVIAAGAAAGAATAVKWSGIWVLAAIGIYLVVTDALQRRRLGVTNWTVDAVRQGAAAFVLLVPIGLLVYLSSWIGWLRTDGGWGRTASPNALQSLWQYHEAIYRSMTGMTSPHSYASPAWQWPILWRPTAMHAGNAADGVNGCAAQNGCLEIVYSMPNPLLWYASVAAAIYLVYRFVGDRQWQHAFVLVGIAATWVPWLAFPERTVFQFYTIAIWPFLLLALGFALREIAGASSLNLHRRASGQGVVLVFLVAALALSAFWYPLWSGMQVPYDFYRLHNWMQGWV